MALEKKITYDYDVRGEYKHINERQRTAIVEDGEELSFSYHRRVLTPDMDVSDEPQEVQDICAVVWTDEVKQAWSDFQAAQQP